MSFFVPGSEFSTITNHTQAWDKSGLAKIKINEC